MSQQIDQSLDLFDINRNFSNKETIILDYSNENSKSPRNTKSFLISNKSINKIDKEKKANILENDASKDLLSLTKKSILKKKDDEINTGIKRLSIEETNKNSDNINIGHRELSKELEDIKQENKFLKNKLEELTQKQKNKNNMNDNILKKKCNTNFLKNIKINNFSKKNNNQKKVIKKNNSRTKNNNNTQIRSLLFFKKKSTTPNITKINNHSKNMLNIKRIKTVVENKLPSFKTNFKNRIYTLNSLSKLNKEKNSYNSKIFSHKKNGKTEYEKFLELKDKIIINNNNKKNNKSITKDILYDNIFSRIDYEINEKNTIIGKINNRIFERDKILDNRISLLIRDKNKINEKLYLLQKEKEEFRMKKNNEIKNYINNLNNNQRLINELNNEKERLNKSRKEIELINQKLKNIILQERKKRHEYKYLYEMHQHDLEKNLNRRNNSYKNKSGFMKLKYDIIYKENQEMKKQISSLKEKLENKENGKIISEENKSNNNLLKKVSFEENKNMKKNESYKIFIYHDNEEVNGGKMNKNDIIKKKSEDIKNSSNSFTLDIQEEEDINVNKEQKDINKSKEQKDSNDIKKSKDIFHSSKNNDIIKINKEEMIFFNKQIELISENRINQNKMQEIQSELLEKNKKIEELEQKMEEVAKNYKTEEEKLKNEKENLNKLLKEEKEKFNKLREKSTEQEKIQIKYKEKYENYKNKVKNYKEQMNKRNYLTTIYPEVQGLSKSDTKVLIRLREEILILREKLEEEKTKNEVLKLLAENEKAKNDNFHTKFQTAKKLNGELISKLKERDISISKNIINESKQIKQQFAEKDKKIEELKLEIKKLYNEIDIYKKEANKNVNKEKDYIKENTILKDSLNKKDILIKESNDKLDNLNNKYINAKNQNKRLTLQLKELNLRNLKILGDKKRIPKHERDSVGHINSTTIGMNIQKLGLKSPDPRSEDSEKFNYSNISNNSHKLASQLSMLDPRSTNDLYYLKNHKMKFYDENKLSTLTKYKNNTTKTINEINEDNISISENSSISNEDVLNEAKNKKEKITQNILKEKNRTSNSSSFSEDNKKILKEIKDKENLNDVDKNHEKTVSSLKDDKSTKMDLEKNTNIPSNSET